jgi:hypothetical protein
MVRTAERPLPSVLISPGQYRNGEQEHNRCDLCGNERVAAAHGPGAVGCA